MPSPAPPSRDRLSNLPPELLTKIYKLLREDKNYFPSQAVAINHQLLPFTLPNLYHKIRITSYEALGLLCRTLVESPARGSLVEAMDIELEGKEGDVDDELDLVRLSDSFLVRDVELGGEGLAKDELDLAQVETAFINLRCLWRLWISGSSTVAKVVLSCEVCHYGLDNLTILRITNSFPSNTTFAPHLTDGLRALPKLRWLVLEFEALQPNPRRSRFMPIWDLGMLDVTGPLIEPVLADFLQQCPSLHDLRLTDTSDSMDFSLRHIPAPDFNPFLDAAPRELSLLRVDHHEKLTSIGQQHPRIDNILRHFAHLEDLFFDQILRNPLPLKALGFGYYSKFRAEQVLSLLVEPKKLSSLQKLTMDNIYGRVGLTFEGVGGSPPFMPGGGAAIPEDWVLGEWHDAFSLEAAQELVRVAEEVGVELEGTMLDELRAEEAWKVYLVRVEKWLERRSRKRERRAQEQYERELW